MGDGLVVHRGFSELCAFFAGEVFADLVVGGGVGELDGGVPFDVAVLLVSEVFEVLVGGFLVVAGGGFGYVVAFRQCFHPVVCFVSSDAGGVSLLSVPDEPEEQVEAVHSGFDD